MLDVSTFANAAIAIDYLGIGALLLWSGRRLQRPAAQRFNLVMAAFILSCATGHGLEAVGEPMAHEWHIITAGVSTLSLVLLYQGQEQITKLAAADLVNERVLSLYPNPVGLYQAVGDDLLILYQNPAAIAQLGADYTGQLLGRVMPAHRKPTPYSNVPLLDTYLQVAHGSAGIELDVYYPGDGKAEGWYQMRCFPAGPAQVLITWHDVSRERLSLGDQLMINDIQQAIINREFVLHYQPIVCMNTGDIFGYEALIRWPKDGRIRQPGEFLVKIERTELMSALCYLVAAMACEDLAKWATMPDRAGLHLAINLHPLTVGLPDFESRFNNIVDASGIDRELLVLEITEQALLDSPIIPRLQRMRWAGHPVEIDDWGTGASSFTAAIRYPVTGIKIDRSIVDGIADDPSRQETVRFILTIAELKGWHTIAEGIESESDALFLKSAGITYGQGYYWAKPGPLN